MRRYNCIDCWLFYGLIIGMVLVLTTVVNDAYGNNLCIGHPCDHPIYDSNDHVIGCEGCDYFCTACYSCDTSIPSNPQCKPRFDPNDYGYCCNCTSACSDLYCKECNSVTGQCRVCGGRAGETCCGERGSGGCCKANLCQECVGGICFECGGRPYEHCCNGQCYNETTQECCNNQIIEKATYQCCFDTATQYKCKKEETCCYGNCCDPNQCMYCGEDIFRHICKSSCDPQKCQTCDGAGHCKVCDDDPNKKCCNGTCKEICKQTDNDSLCSSDKNTSCPVCLPYTPPDFYIKNYTDNTIHQCNGGCEGDCGLEGTVHCYTKYSCYGIRDIMTHQHCVWEDILYHTYICVDYPNLTCVLVQPDPNSASDVNVASFGCH
jgi:hypothetical protein